MTDPWDRPPFPIKGALIDDEIYLAMGHALSAWEEYEVDLSWLYAVLTERPVHSEAAYQDYVANADNFIQRATKLETAGCRYFCRRPNQPDEADFIEILRTGRGWSLRRNDIAHSVVRPAPRVYDATSGMTFENWLKLPEEYLLYPPEYAAKKFGTYGRPAYAYGFAELSHFAQVFRENGYQVNALTLRLRRRRA
jgi:hypothetical protein